MREAIEELACRIYADVALQRRVNWRSARSFSQGLREYDLTRFSHRDLRLHLPPSHPPVRGHPPIHIRISASTIPSTLPIAIASTVSSSVNTRPWRILLLNK